MCSTDGVRNSWKLANSAWLANIKREASSSEVTGLKKENDQLKRLVADIMLKNDVLKKSVLGLKSTWEDE